MGLVNNSSENEARRTMLKRGVVRENYGLKQENVRHVTLKNCPRCNNILRPTDKFCSQCSLVLDQQSLDEIGKYEARISKKSVVCD